MFNMYIKIVLMYTKMLIVDWKKLTFAEHKTKPMKIDKNIKRKGKEHQRKRRKKQINQNMTKIKGKRKQNYEKQKKIKL